ncbi:MAG: tRNA pseudouridine(55) synthase TruB [Bradymonadales bacterium]|nr:MAG: tRNA pseudouridine(55) synthase TruB [Bradymonadales bacterium]
MSISPRPSERIDRALGSPAFERATEKFDLSGVLVVDKPEGVTSMDVIRVVRRLLRPNKIGHGGTLDPLATGVLPILLNRATKMSNEVMGGIKEYEGSFLLGQSFDTQDVTGSPLSEPQAIPESLTFEQLKREAEAFVGEIDQTPPIYSAVKSKGKALYEYARAGEQVEPQARKVKVDVFEIRQWDGFRRVKFFVRVHKGTFVRTLIHDLGQRLGVGAALESLRRLQAGRFHIDEAVQLSTLRVSSDVVKHLKPLNRRTNAERIME